MNQSFLDFGKSVVDVHRHAAFILDTNVVLAYIKEDNPKHLAVYHFLNYLTSKDRDLYVTETVVHEVIHVLARHFYAQDKVDQQYHHLSPSKQKEIHLQYQRQFTSVTKQRPYFNTEQSQLCIDILRKYTTKAVQKFLPFLNHICGFLPSSPEQLNFALDLCTDTPLHSSDAMIAASTVNGDFDSVMGLITLDRDMTALSGIQVYFTETNNAQYDLLTMRKLLGFEVPFATENVPTIDC